jgi:hypothetical protein
MSEAFGSRFGTPVSLIRLVTKATLGNYEKYYIGFENQNIEGPWKHPYLSGTQALQLGHDESHLSDPTPVIPAAR